MVCGPLNVLPKNKRMAKKEMGSMGFVAKTDTIDAFC
jgi:hypothetical protein